MLIVLVNTGVSAVNLLFPTERRLDFSVAHSVAIADDKVISDTQPLVARFVLLLQVLLMNTLNTTAVRGCVMDDQVFPIARGYIWLPRIVESDPRPGPIW